VKALVALVVIWLLALAIVEYPAASKPVDPPHVQSDCRAACTLEGMELAGAEITPSGYAPAIRCLCAPITSGGEL
jgi:hypothetical protein